MDLAFTITIKAGDKVREFNFTKIFNTPALKYNIDVVNDHNERISFLMEKKEDGQWQIVSNTAPPGWLMEEKWKLENAVNNEANRL